MKNSELEMASKIGSKLINQHLTNGYKVVRTQIMPKNQCVAYLTNQVVPSARAQWRINFQIITEKLCNGTLNESIDSMHRLTKVDDKNIKVEWIA